MGFIPIFLTLGGFIFLFVMVVSQTLKSKKASYFHSLNSLAGHLSYTGGTKNSLEALESEFMLLKQKQADPADAGQLDLARPHLQNARRFRMEYNRLIKTKPYQFVAKLMGYAPI